MNTETSTHPQAPGVVAGVDYGTVRIGVALTDSERRMAFPHETYTRSDPNRDAKWFQRLVEEHAVRLFVVGLPVHLSGRESQKSSEARAFGKWLAEQTQTPVVFFDERFTTSEAEQHLLAAQLTKKRRKARLDALAAQILLTAFLESGQQGQENPGSLD